MPEVRIVVSHHFTVDPSKLTIGLPELPDEITRTIVVGETVLAEKVPLTKISEGDRELFEVELSKLVLESTRTAKPVVAVVSPPPEVVPETPSGNQEMSLF